MSSDLYEHPDHLLTYIIENELQEDDGTEDFKALKQEFDSQILRCCNCTGDCSSKNCLHGSNYLWGSNELILNDNRKSEDLIYECNSLCECSFDCKNRLVLFGPRKNLEVIDLQDKGKALITKSLILKGSYICEYAGELLTKQEAIKRDKQNTSQNLMNYVVCLNESSQNLNSSTKVQTFIDPSKKGNIGRYLNHSCDPNCTIISVRIDSPVPKLAIFAKKDILPEEELCFHYGGGLNDPQKDQPGKFCHCNSEKCIKILPNWNYE